MFTFIIASISFVVAFVLGAKAGSIVTTTKFQDAIQDEMIKNQSDDEALEELIKKI